MQILENISLKDFNSFKIDAKARYFCELNSSKDIQQIIKNGILTEHPFIILGNGCNILFSDDYKGVILKINNKGIYFHKETENNIYIEAAAGEDWDNFIIYCINNNYFGLENLSLIPGSIGASPIQNIGAYGIELKDVFHQLEAVSIESGDVKTFSRDECKFGYRDSIFKHQQKNKFIISSVTFKLRKKPSFNCNYADLREEISKRGITELNAKIVREIVCDIRIKKLPYPSELGNAGSFFKNPIINESKFTELKNKFPEIKFYESPGNKYKLAAAWLIEHCGWKGKRIGNVGVHKEQALVIVNYGNASGNEVLDFAQQLINAVIEKFGILLDMEINII